MSGIEVVAAVAAVVSAFHGGSELVKIIKEKRRRARAQAQQELEQTQLHDALITGEQQIRIRYDQDVRELGDIMRVGDVTARERLNHVKVMMDAEIIRNLQVAIYSEAQVNLVLLQRASIANRDETILILNELKQRIFIARPILQQLSQNDSWGKRVSMASVQSEQTNSVNLSSLNAFSSSSSMTSPSMRREAKSPISNMSSFFKRKNTVSTSERSASSLPAPSAPDYNAALASLVQARGMDRSVIMQDIDSIISSYQNLRMNEMNEPQNIDFFSPSRPDVSGYPVSSQQDGHYGLGLTASTTRMSPQSSSPHEYWTNPTSPNGSIHPYGSHLKLEQGTATSETQGLHLLSTQRQYWNIPDANSSSSDAHSLNRNDSNSSQNSHSFSPSFSTDPFSPDDVTCFRSTSMMPNMAHKSEGIFESETSGSVPFDTDIPVLPPIAPLSPMSSINGKAGQNFGLHARGETNTRTQAAENDGVPPRWSTLNGSRHANDRIARLSVPNCSQNCDSEDGHDAKTDKHHAISPSSPGIPSINSGHTTIPSLQVDPTPNTHQTTSTINERHSSVSARSISSTSSTTSIPIGVLPGPYMRSRILRDSIHSGPTGGERMMIGRPRRANNYWGFCKGSWTIRESPDKGLKKRTQPVGLYNTRDLWECRECSFQGAVFMSPHPTRRNDTVPTFDPQIYTSHSGIRYRWLFLAKGHVRKHLSSSLNANSNYGCVICAVEGMVTSVYGSAETLMNHIAAQHVSDMSEATRRTVKCVLGRVAGEEEDFDLNVPIFERVEVGG